MTQTQSHGATAAPVARCGDRVESPRRLGPWELVEKVAAGSLSEVYRARPADGPTDRPPAYAVKVLRAAWQDDPRPVRLMQREALVGRSVSHPHLISILQARVSRTPRYVVMPWLHGTSLRSRRAAGEAVDLPVALWIIRQVAEALGALHAAGWMHGDVKPGNVLISPEGHATLLDLGFARRADESGSVTDRCVLGTFDYIAPEWITSALRADVRSDIYSLGVMLFELLCGRLPFVADDLAALAEQHLRASPPPLDRLAPRLPPEVVELVRQMLAKEPLRRPQTPGELIARVVPLEIASFEERSYLQPGHSGKPEGGVAARG